MIDQDNIQQRPKRTNCKQLLNNVYEDVPTIHQYLQQIFLTQT